MVAKRKGVIVRWGLKEAWSKRTSRCTRNRRHQNKDFGTLIPSDGITTYLQNGGKLEVAQQMTGHESARTTGLYDRRNDSVELDKVERVIYQETIAKHQ